MQNASWRLGKLTRTRADKTTYWSWCIKWNDDEGRRHRQALGTTDKAVADARARRFWSELTHSSVATIGELVERYLDSLGGKLGEARKREAWKAAKGFWANFTFAEVTETTSADYQKWRGKALNTMRNELSLIRAACTWGATKEVSLLDADEVPPIRVPGMPDSEVGHLTKANFKKFLDGCCAPHVKFFAQLKVTTGARSKHILELPWIRVDLERKLINFKPPPVRQATDGEKPAVEAANKLRAIVPINDRLLPLLIEAKAAAMTPFVIECNGKRVGSVRKGFEAASRRSGVKCTPLMLRHSAAVWMAEAGVPMSEIAAYLGHSDIKITARIYARYQPDYLQKAAKALDWSDVNLLPDAAAKR